MEIQIKNILFDPVIGKIVAVIVGLIIIRVIVKIIQINVFNKIKDKDNRYKARKIGSFVGYVISVLLITIVYSQKLGGLTVAFGVAGAGIAFALQEVIASFAGWLAIMFGGFYKTGDRVQLGGIKGDVMDIGVLRTTLMEMGQWVDGDLYNGRIVLIANSFIFKEPVFNYSGDFPFLWDEIKVPIQFGSNYEKTTSILKQAAIEIAGDLTKESKDLWTSLQRKFPLEDSQTEPVVTLVVNDNWVEFTVRYVVGYKKRRHTKSLLFTKILHAVEASNGEIKFASVTFRVVGVPDLNVNMK